MKTNPDYYYYCSECRKKCNDVQRDFGRGSYEYWGVGGVDTNWQWVSECCDGDLVTQEELHKIMEEEEIEHE